MGAVETGDTAAAGGTCAGVGSMPSAFAHSPTTATRMFSEK